MFFEPQRPMPFIATLHRRQREVAAILEGAVGWVWPWDRIGEITNDLPTRKYELDLVGVLELQRSKFEPPGFECGCREAQELVSPCFRSLTEYKPWVRVTLTTAHSASVVLPLG